MSGEKILRKTKDRGRKTVPGEEKVRDADVKKSEKDKDG